MKAGKVKSIEKTPKTRIILVYPCFGPAARRWPSPVGIRCRIGSADGGQPGGPAIVPRRSHPGQARNQPAG